MAITIDIDTGILIVQQLFPNAAEPLLSLELEATKIDNNYRPYIVAAKLIMTEYRQVIKADVVTFQYDGDVVMNLLKRQKDLDKINGVVDDVLDAMLLELCETCETSSTPALGVFLV